MVTTRLRLNEQQTIGARWRQSGAAECGRAQVIAAGLLVLISMALGSAIIHLRPDQSYTAGFVLGEEGNQLYRADRVLHGLLPYRDFASQYGFVPIYLSSGFAWAFGNTMATNRLFHLVLSTICIVLLFALLRRTLNTIGSFIASVAFLPVMLAVGLQLGNSTNVEYLSVERICLLAIMLIWRPPTQRTWRRAVALGITLGIWQEVKFGGAFFAGAALVAADLIWMTCKKTPREDALLWLGSSAFTLGSFMLLECIWLLLLFATSPSDLAANAAWPAYVTGSYLKFKGEHRFPHFNNLSYFVESQWIFFSCAVISIRGLIAWGRESRRADSDSSDLALFVGTLFFLIASPFYFAHEWLWYQYCWAFVPGACWCVARMPVVALLLLTASWIPTWFFLLHTATSGIDPSLIRYGLPDSQVIYVTDADSRTIDLFSKTAARANDSAKFVLALMQWSGGGFQFFFDRKFALRNYMIDEYSFRPRDQAELLSKLDRVGAIVGYQNGTETKTRFERIFGPALSLGLFNRFVSASPDKNHLIMTPQ